MLENTTLTGGARRVLAHLEELVSSNGLAPGDRLPTERALAESLNASRTEVRRALTQLEVEGRVLRQVGRGTYLTPPSGATSSPPLFSSSPADLMAARLLLEPRVMSMAALAAKREDFAEMDRCLKGGDGTDVYEEFESWDIALHRSFAVATHNNVVMAMVEILHSSRHDPVWGGLKRRSFTIHTCGRYRVEHHAIVGALHERDPAAAAAAMTSHLESVKSAILG